VTAGALDELTADVDDAAVVGAGELELLDEPQPAANATATVATAVNVRTGRRIGSPSGRTQRPVG
jgi:hypothetical protein